MARTLLGVNSESINSEGVLEWDWMEGGGGGYKRVNSELQHDVMKRSLKLGV